MILYDSACNSTRSTLDQGCLVVFSVKVWAKKRKCFYAVELAIDSPYFKRSFTCDYIMFWTLAKRPGR